MAFIPIANIAQRNVNRMAEPRQEIDAIIAATPAMEEEIAMRSGASPVSGVMRTNLYSGESAAAADKAYAQALTRALPKYVNAYRAYLEEQKKKNKGDGSTSPYTTTYTQPPTLPPITQYLPQMGLVPDVVRGTLYGTSPYGAMPLGQYKPSTSTKPASRVLAQRRVSSTRGKAGME